MSNESQTCPECSSPNGYHDGQLWTCPECGHEWTAESEKASTDSATKFVDANGTELQSGDTVRVIRDLKAGKGTIKSGTKVKNIRLLDDPVNGHDIGCKIDGHGAVYLKCSVVRKI